MWRNHFFFRRQAELRWFDRMNIDRVDNWILISYSTFFCCFLSIPLESSVDVVFFVSTIEKEKKVRDIIHWYHDTIINLPLLLMYNMWRWEMNFDVQNLLINALKQILQRATALKEETKGRHSRRKSLLT